MCLPRDLKRVERILELYFYLAHSRWGRTVDEIADFAGVHQRTVWRDLNLLDSIPSITLKKDRRPDGKMTYRIVAGHERKETEAEGFVSLRSTSLSSSFPPRLRKVTHYFSFPTHERDKGRSKEEIKEVLGGMVRRRRMGYMTYSVREGEKRTDLIVPLHLFTHAGADHLAYLGAPYDALKLLPLETVSGVQETHGSELIYESHELQEIVTILKSVLGKDR